MDRWMYDFNEGVPLSPKDAFIMKWRKNRLEGCVVYNRLEAYTSYEVAVINRVRSARIMTDKHDIWLEASTPQRIYLV